VETNHGRSIFGGLKTWPTLDLSFLGPVQCITYIL
jgi:hypothetical protein